jgi:hypothetical protein
MHLFLTKTNRSSSKCQGDKKSGLLDPVVISVSKDQRVVPWDEDIQRTIMTGAFQWFKVMIASSVHFKCSLLCFLYTKIASN